jgi:uncharacterized phage protein gp47/JayE
MAVTLQQLLTPQTQAQLYQIALATFQANNFPITAWQPLGTEQTRLMAFTAALADIVGNYIPAFAAGGYLDYATGAWLQLLAQELYSLAFNPATFTQGNITLTAAPGVGPISVAAGNVLAVFASTGNRYILNASGTIPQGGSVSLQFQAEAAGANYNDGSNQNLSNSGQINLATPIPGVYASNPAGAFTGVAHIGIGTGSVTPSGSPTAPHQVIVSVTATGNLGIAAFSYQLDAGAVTSLGVVSSVTNLAGTGINITFANGATGTSFVIGDSYTFNNPGSWITQQGSNVETDSALAQRCRNRWFSLSAAPTAGFYQLLAQSTPGVGSQVTQCIVLPDVNINNKVNIVVAGPSGVLPPITVAAIQTYISPRARGTDNPVVQSPATTNVTYAGAILVSIGQLSAAQSAIQVAMTNYTSASSINPTLRLAAITELVMQVTGVLDMQGLTINGAAANLVLGSQSSFVLPVLQPLAFSYVTTQ